MNQNHVKQGLEHSRKFLDEFRAFALKGNVMDMAIGVIIGASFQSIVSSLTGDILNPLLGIAFSTDFSNVVIPLPNGADPLRIGAFLSAVINFVIMAFVLFCLVKFMGRLMRIGQRKKAEAEAAAKAAKPASPTQEELLAQILAELKAQNRQDS
ncbi:large conductance mechanosensitive channel protein MscL [Gemmiger formicilis]|uniref:large conductance mechanosensitive channel protein MscL n=1 Tax=Gemmiger formicilis TaxID=745368 RepID=UPI00195A93BC|nr:large conductance mechanosensitive channel protein MscL [Gemmiger formicilis]MBM6900459.1 large conductance mechanosensitive channel protein MscL [Gemmiger formicilis]